MSDKKIIVFIGNCQTVGLCYLLQKLLESRVMTGETIIKTEKNINNDYIVYWLLFGELFRRHVGKWADKCKNKILEEDSSIEIIKHCDIIIYQDIMPEKSNFGNDSFLKKNIKDGCKTIKIPSMHIKINTENVVQNFLGLHQRTTNNNVDISVSDLILKYGTDILFNTTNHISTFFMLEILKRICLLINIDFFSLDDYQELIKNRDIMNLK